MVSKFSVTTQIMVEYESIQSNHNNRVFTKRLSPISSGILLLALLGYKESVEAQQLRGLRVEVAPDEQTYVLHAPVYVVVSVQNGLSQAVKFSFGRNNKSHSTFLSLCRTGGYRCSASERVDSGLAGVSTQSLAPGRDLQNNACC
jgi:hypothetical protein